MSTTDGQRPPAARFVLTAPSAITVVCADRYELGRLGVAYLTNRNPELKLVAETATLNDLPAILSRTRPAVLVVGDDLSVEGGRLVAEVRAARPSLGVVVVSHHVDDALFPRFRDSGASAFVSRSAPASAVLAAIRHAATAPAQFRTFGVSWSAELEASRRPALSRRERQVLDLLRAGHAAGDIANELRVGRGTVRTHVSRLYAKLGVSNRSQALVASLEDQLVTPR